MATYCPGTYSWGSDSGTGIAGMTVSPG